MFLVDFPSEKPRKDPHIGTIGSSPGKGLQLGLRAAYEPWRKPWGLTKMIQKSR